MYYENWEEEKSEREAMLLRQANDENKAAVFDALRRFEWGEGGGPE